MESVENALEHAGEVSNKRYGSACSASSKREQVFVVQAVVTLARKFRWCWNLPSLERHEETGIEHDLSALPRGARSKFLLRELGSEAGWPARFPRKVRRCETDLPAACFCCGPFTRICKALPASHALAVWLTLESRVLSEREAEVWARALLHRTFPSRAGEGRSSLARL